MTITSRPPTTTICGLCDLKIAYGQRENHARAHGLHAWRITWSPAGDFPCSAHEACLATGFAYGTFQKLTSHIARLKQFPIQDDPAEAVTKPERLCTLSGCNRVEKAAGLCSGHLTRRDRGMTNWDAPLRERRVDTERERVEAALAILREHGVLVTIELPVTVLENMAAAVEHDILPKGEEG